MLWSDKIDRLGKFVTSFSNWLNWVAGAGLVAMFSLALADIIGIKLFHQPIPGGIEVVAFLGVMVSAPAIAYTQVLHKHVRIEFVVMRLPKQMQAIISACVSLLGLVLFALLAWQSYEFACALRNSGEVSLTLRIPFYPFIYIIAFCCIPVCLILLMEFVRSVMQRGAR